VSELRVGFIGTGRISDLHALEYLQNPRARIVAVCDTQPALAQQRAAAWQVPPAQIYRDHREMLARAQLDLEWNPGDYVFAEVAPWYELVEDISILAGYRYFWKGKDSFALW